MSEKKTTAKKVKKIHEAKKKNPEAVLSVEADKKQTTASTDLQTNAAEETKVVLNVAVEDLSEENKVVAAAVKKPVKLTEEDLMEALVRMNEGNNTEKIIDLRGRKGCPRSGLYTVRIQECDNNQRLQYNSRLKGDAHV